MGLLLILYGLFAIGLVLWAVICVSGDKRRKKELLQQFESLCSEANAARAQHQSNADSLGRIGFRTDRRAQIGDRYFYFDHGKKLAACEQYRIADIAPDPAQPNGLAAAGYSALPRSYCTQQTVFAYDRITECVLVQDGAAVKSSSGTAVLAGTSVPFFGVVQGKAVSSGDEHQTGLLSVRLTLDDIRTPSLVFHFTGGGVDKSSAQYAAAFQQAQEVFGIFDAIVRINLREKAQAPQTAAPAAAAPGASDAPGRDDVFEKIRQLGRLRDEALLTEEEFAQKKKALMEQIQ
ncbi:MAG: SHOCT domain-containing protein [Oscillospiraceae bacterium]|nr:SHOCT domain-containing protein [Oscillospiraceae bacterium]